MCEFCSTDPEDVRKAKARALNFADLLLDLADQYRQMGCGLLRPHSNQSAEMDRSVKRVIRQLVEEWI